MHTHCPGFQEDWDAWDAMDRLNEDIFAAASVAHTSTSKCSNMQQNTDGWQRVTLFAFGSIIGILWPSRR